MKKSPSNLGDNENGGVYAPYKRINGKLIIYHDKAEYFPPGHEPPICETYDGWVMVKGSS